MRIIYMVALLLLVLTITGLAQQGPHGHPLVLPSSEAQFDAPASHPAMLAAQGAATAAWIPVGLGLELPGWRATIMDDTLYVLSFGVKGGNYTGQIYRLDNSSWTLLTEFTVNAYMYAFGSYKGDLYVGGYFTNLNGIDSTQGIARWDGSAWHSVGNMDNNMAGSPMAMIEYKGELYVGGTFTRIGGKRFPGLARWNGTRWAGVGDSSLVSFSQNRPADVTSFAMYNDELVIGGRFQGADDVESPYVISWDGTEWRGLGDGLNREPEELEAYNDELYVSGPYITRAGTTTLHNLARWNGSRWDSVGAHDRWMNIRDMEVHNGRLYTGGGGDLGVGASWDGSSWTELPAIDGIPEFSISYNGSLYIGGWFSRSGLTPLHYVARLCDEGECAQITGTIFRDIDNDCALDSTESGLTGRIVEITPGPYFTTTDSAGRFAQWVPSGTYTVGVTPRPYWNLTCPSSPGTIAVTISQAGDIDSSALFAMQPAGDVNDLRISIAGGRMRPGFTVPFTIVYENVGTTKLSGTVHLDHDTRLTPASSDPSITRTGTGWIEWDFSNLDIDDLERIDLTMSLSDSAALNTNIALIAAISPIDGDSTSHDNRDTLNDVVRGSYDPNDISVSPTGNAGAGWITTADSVLTYTIRFQNTGTDTAFTVVVRDTLTSTLNPATIHLGATSHPATFSMSSNGALIWRFDNILLPDSNVNEPASHGYIKYSVHMRPELPNGTIIPNRADIYFDFNQPVRTNTVESLLMGIASVSSPKSVEINPTIYPNPAQSIVHIEGHVAGGGVFEMKDIFGRTLLLQRVTETSGTHTIDLSTLAAGTYILSIPTADGRLMRTLSVVR